MKKYISTLFLIFLFLSCATQRSKLDSLTIGMTKQEVQYVLGYPDRLLEARYIDGEYLEVLQYRIHNDVYALEFWNDYLNACEFLYEEMDYYYVPPVQPPLYYPPVGISPPVVIQPGKPGNGRPGTTPHPGSSNPGNSGYNTEGRVPANSGGSQTSRPGTNNPGRESSNTPANPPANRGGSNSGGRVESGSGSTGSGRTDSSGSGGRAGSSSSGSNRTTGR